MFLHCGRAPATPAAMQCQRPAPRLSPKASWSSVILQAEVTVRRLPSSAGPKAAARHNAGPRGGGGLSKGGGRYTGSGRQRRRRRRRQAWFDCRRYVPDDTKLPPPPAEAACRGAGGPCERNTLPVEEGASAGAPGGVSMLRSVTVTLIRDDPLGGTSLTNTAG